MEDKMLKVQEVAMMIDSSVQTISGWYRWRTLHPDHPLAKLLPDYKREGKKNTRYWRQSDIWKLIQFKKSIPQGCRGIMGDVTQKYVKKKTKDEVK